MRWRMFPNYLYSRYMLDVLSRNYLSEFIGGNVKCFGFAGRPVEVVQKSFASRFARLLYHRYLIIIDSSIGIIDIRYRYRYQVSVSVNKNSLRASRDWYIIGISSLSTSVSVSSISGIGIGIGIIDIRYRYHWFERLTPHPPTPGVQQVRHPCIGMYLSSSL